MRSLIKRVVLHGAVKDQNSNRAPISSPYGVGQDYIIYTNKYKKNKTQEYLQKYDEMKLKMENIINVFI